MKAGPPRGGEEVMVAVVAAFKRKSKIWTSGAPAKTYKFKLKPISELGTDA
jgi:hypothetical protein